MFIEEGSGMFTHLSWYPYLCSPESYSAITARPAKNTILLLQGITYPITYYYFSNRVKQ